MKKLFLVLLMVWIMQGVCGAGPLDEPGEKKITVKSEIARGYRAASNVNSSLPGITPTDDVISALVKAKTAYELNNTDSDGFLLGYCYRVWSISSYYSWLPNPSKFTEDIAGLNYKSFRSKQLELGINDDDFFTALYAELGYDNESKKIYKKDDMAKLAKWESTHPSKK